MTLLLFSFQATAKVTPEVIRHQILSIEGMSKRNIADFDTIFYGFCGTKDTYDRCKAWLLVKMEKKHEEVKAEAEQTNPGQGSASKRKR